MGGGPDWRRGGITEGAGGGPERDGILVSDGRESCQERIRLPRLEDRFRGFYFIFLIFLLSYLLDTAPIPKARRQCQKHSGKEKSMDGT